MFIGIVFFLNPDVIRFVMVAFWKVVNNIIDDADLLLLVLDARQPELSRNKEIERRIQQKGKHVVYVLNKADLVEDEPKQADLRPSIAISSTQHQSTMRLLRLLSRMSNGKPLTVGVLGYPNTGKSSLINALKGKASAGVSSVSGYTRGVQKVRITKTIMLLDSPGVFPRKEMDEVKHALLGAKDVQKLKDPESVAVSLIEALKGKVEQIYAVETGADAYAVLEAIAKKRHFLKKGGQPDTTRAAKHLIERLQKGT